MCESTVGDSATARTIRAGAGCAVDATPHEPLAVFASDFGLSFCRSLETCCVDWNFSRAVCENAMQWLDVAVSTARRDDFVYDELSAVRCLDDLERTDPCRDHVPSRCGLVFESLLEPGDPCESALECPPDSSGRWGCELDADGTRRCAGADRPPSNTSCDPNELDPCPMRPCNAALCGQPDSFICVVGLGSIAP